MRRLAAVVCAVVVATSHVDAQSPHTNRLMGEKSPYLKLHAHDPVDWYPWGPEAFEKARREDKPIFLSVGYSTCHWCHVMHAESFLNPAIAELMNRFFVSIKVDREERPDIDRVYMAYVTSVSNGGWPMTVFLTPDRKPFFGASYLPPEDQKGEPGLRTLLTGVSGLWTNERGKALAAAHDSMELLESRAKGLGASKDRAGAAALDSIYTTLRKTYDVKNGGFGGAPKFPRPVALNFLLRYYARTGARPALDMTVGTLRAMARGGIHDQLGGGFHRYATDEAWRVPHFEKMLYDQAQLALAYTEAYQVTKDRALGDVARDTLDYVIRDMRDAAGGFVSAEDADSEGTEGAYYVWTAARLHEALDPMSGAPGPSSRVRRSGPRAVDRGGLPADVFAFHYGIEPDGNVPRSQDIRGELAGRNVLVARHTVSETAAKFRKPAADTRALLDRARRQLRDARLARPRPSRDDKVLVAWNGMMISALARAAQVFGDARYLQAADGAARFIQTRMQVVRNPQPGTPMPPGAPAASLRRRYMAGDVDIDAVAEDYAFLIQGLLDLYEASFDVTWLSWAMNLQTEQDRLFWDATGGGYFSTAAAAADILARFKDDYDGAEPSANSVSAMNLLRLWQVADRKEWRAKADAIFRVLAPQLVRAGTAVPQLAVALDFSLSTPKQIVVAGQPGAADTRALLRLVHQRFLPTKILLLADGGAGQRQIAQWLPTVGPMRRLGGRATIYVCENYVCRLPTADFATAAALLDGKAPMSSTR